MNPQHTPGPWVLDENGDSPNRPFTVGKLFYNVADVGNRADATLISAAPEMLSALKSCEEWIEHTVEQLQTHDKGLRLNWGGPLAKLRSAIARAEGRA